MSHYLSLQIGGNTIQTPQDIRNLEANAGDYGAKIVSVGINLLLLGIVIASLFFIIYGGIQWITSEGDAKKVEGARNTIIYACIGLGIAFLSFFFVNILKTFFGFHP